MNKGEWSEFYTFLKLLGDGEIYGAEGDLVINKDWRYPVVEICALDVFEKPISYKIDLKNPGFVHVVGTDTDISVPQADFDQMAKKLFNTIKNAPGGPIEAPFLEGFRQQIGNPKVKQMSGKKADIHVVLHDLKVARNQKFGFSIKSQLGEPSTLYNASVPTNFTFEVTSSTPITQGVIDDFNDPKWKKDHKMRQIHERIKKHTLSLRYVDVEDKDCKNNLKILETFLPEIFSYLLIYRYELGQDKNLTSLLASIEAEDPLEYDAQPQTFYTYKIKHFLIACALGMQPATTWNGSYDATGGYIVVKEDGTIACYHAYNWNAFQDYLFGKAFLETGSTGKHHFGALYKYGNDIRLKLNLQVRFNH